MNPAPPPTDGAPPLEPRPGLATRLIVRLMFRTANVAGNEQLAPGMHLITLQGPALRGQAWSPGDKLQVRLGPTLQTRTYTPVNWDADNGRTQILAHTLAPGPGSVWVGSVTPGQDVSLFGPRPSLALGAVDASRAVLVGDETAMGLAAAWRPGQAIFEVGQRAPMQDLLDALGVAATAVQRQAGDQHLDALVNAMLGLAASDTHFVLVGRARTVQRLQRALRASAVPGRRILTKAYWAEGKSGLD